MVPKHGNTILIEVPGFRAVLFRMVPKLRKGCDKSHISFRAVLFRMVPKLLDELKMTEFSFRAVL
uniref:hypothetical protein n=1 Tax=Streptococcus agalactiae TaxID=1311 RepID=UPI00085BEE81